MVVEGLLVDIGGMSWLIEMFEIYGEVMVVGVGE